MNNERNIRPIEEQLLAERKVEGLLSGFGRFAWVTEVNVLVEVGILVRNVLIPLIRDSPACVVLLALDVYLGTRAVFVGSNIRPPSPFDEPMKKSTRGVFVSSTGASA